jgi:hypothetical protein
MRALGHLMLRFGEWAELVEVLEGNPAGRAPRRGSITCVDLGRSVATEIELNGRDTFL